MKVIKKLMKKAAVFLSIAVFAAGMSGCDKSIKITTGLKDDVIFKLSDKKCSTSEILISLINEKNKYERNFGSSIWNKQVGDITMEDSIKETVKSGQVYLEAMCMMAQEKGITLSDDEKTRLSEGAKEYFQSLSDKEKEMTGVTQDDIYSIYEKNCISEKLYSSVADSVNYEVSDEEARVMSVMYIYIPKDEENSKDKINEAYGKIVAGADFYTVASEYTYDDIIRMDITRERVVKEVEKAAYELKNDSCTDIITAEKGYYIIKCVDSYLKDKTETNREAILTEKKNSEFRKEFEPFLEKQKLDFNNKVWNKIKLADYSDCTTDTLFEVYDKYME